LLSGPFKKNCVAPEESEMPITARADAKLCVSLVALAILGFTMNGRLYAQQQPEGYTLHPGDQLEIGVWKEPELQKTIVVRPDGRFSFPLVGEIVAVNRTISQVQAEIESKLKRYIPEPVLSITLTDVGGNRVYVIGQVRNPGSFVMNPRLNVLQALSLAGGLTPFASANNISVIRTKGGRQSVLPFRYEDVNRGRNLEQNIMLESGDVVVVP